MVLAKEFISEKIIQHRIDGGGKYEEAASKEEFLRE
jgi:hypothetical protein